MSSPLILAVAAVVATVLLMIIAYLVWSRRRTPFTPPPATPAPASTFSYADDPRMPSFDDEWEANANFPGYTPRAARAADPFTHAESTRPQREFAFDDIEQEDRDPPLRPVLTESAADLRAMAPPPVPVPAASTPVVHESGLHCPRCNSRHVDTLNIGRRAGGTLGSVAGATGGVAMALSGAEAGAVVGAIGGPVGSIFGGLAGAVIAGLIGSAAGNAAGSVVGGALDDNVLDNYRCLSCGHTFGSTLH